MAQANQTIDLHTGAVEQANMARRAAALGWRHLQSEYTQHIPTVLATIETDGPWTWTLPNSLPTADAQGVTYPGCPDELHFVSATSMAEIEEQYVTMRETIELWDWISMTELRGNWYMLTSGVAFLIDVNSKERFSLESATLFPIGQDGILGEVQIGNLANQRVNRWPEVPSAPGDIPLPLRRMHANRLLNDFVDSLRTENVDAIVATCRPNIAAAIRDYTTADYTVLNAEGAEAIGDYYRHLFERFAVREILFVNRVVESWWTFAELHWTVEYRTGERAGQLAEFCTADMAPIDADGKFWVRTGAGTDPVPSTRTDAGTQPIAHERGPRRGWEDELIAASEAGSG